MTYDSAFSALACGTRRAILRDLAGSAKTVGRLAQGLPVSRPAVSQHLKVLSDAGLVTVTPKGTRNLYALNPQGLAPLRAYLDEMWSDALTAFAAAAQDMAQETPSNDEN